MPGTLAGSRPVGATLAAAPNTAFGVTPISTNVSSPLPNRTSPPNLRVWRPDVQLSVFPKTFDLEIPPAGTPLKGGPTENTLATPPAAGGATKLGRYPMPFATGNNALPSRSHEA